MVKALLFLYYIGAYTFGIITLLRAASFRTEERTEVFRCFFILTITIYMTLSIGILQNYLLPPSGSRTATLFSFTGFLLAILFSFSLIQFFLLVFFKTHSRLFRIISAAIAVLLILFLCIGFFLIDRSFLQSVLLSYKNIAILGTCIIGISFIRSPDPGRFEKFLRMESLCALPLIPLFVFTEIPAFKSMAPDFIQSVPLAGPWALPAAGILWGIIFLSCFPSKSRLDPRTTVLREDYVLKTGLTPRETEVAKLLLEGQSYKSIGDKLAISIPTVKTHLSNIYKKTGSANRLDLAGKAGTFPHTKE